MNNWATRRTAEAVKYPVVASAIAPAAARMVVASVYWRPQTTQFAATRLNVADNPNRRLVNEVIQGLERDCNVGVSVGIILVMYQVGVSLQGRGS